VIQFTKLSVLSTIIARTYCVKINLLTMNGSLMIGIKGEFFYQQKADRNLSNNRN